MLDASFDVLEKMMRFSPFVLLLGVTASTMAVPVVGQEPVASAPRGDDVVNVQSAELLKKGEAALAAGTYAAADDALEAALVADPKNRKAFVALARVAAKQQLYGQAIRFTNRALVLEPTDREALKVQGEAMVEAGATARAKDTLAKLQKLCTSGCPEAAALSAAIQRGPTMAAATKPAADTVKKN